MARTSRRRSTGTPREPIEGASAGAGPSGAPSAQSPNPAPWGSGLYPPAPKTSPIPGAGPIPAYPVLTEEVGYPPSPVANGGTQPSRNWAAGRNGALGPVVTKALQDVLGWKPKLLPATAEGSVKLLLPPGPPNGFARFGWLKILKHSARNCAFSRSLKEIGRAHV